MEPPTPIEIKIYKKEISNKQIIFNIITSEEILSLSAEYDNKKYRILYSIEELYNLNNFFKQFSSIEEILKVFDKIISSSNTFSIENNKLSIKFKNFLDEEISLSLLEENKNIDLVYLELKKYQIENNLLKKALANKEIQINKDLPLLEKSSILKKEDIQMIKNWINPNREISFKLLYKATRDGDEPKDFHRLCDEIPSTLTLGETTNGNRFGGYTSASYPKNTTDKAVYDENAFVFSIDSKVKYNTNNPSYAIRSLNSRGPCFGSSCPFYIEGKCLHQNKNFSNPSNDFNSPPYILTGSQYFTLKELEVYKVEFL